jgi:hypothetical protein
VRSSFVKNGEREKEASLDYDRERYKAWKLPNPWLVHWVINPGLAFNELVLGQRLPAFSLIERDRQKALKDRESIVPCPSCGAMNDGALYGETALGNYAGLSCVECGAKIPALKNVFTWLILMVTWPLWKPFELRLGPGLLARQQATLQAAKAKGLPEEAEVSGLRMGLFFGVFMGLFFLAQRLLYGADLQSALIVASVSAVFCGVFFGVAMKIFMTWRPGRGLRA